MQVEVTRQIFLCFVVDFKELAGFVWEFLTHVSNVCKFFEVICGETHVSSHFTFVHTLSEYMSCVSENVLIELDCYKFVSADELSKVW